MTVATCSRYQRRRQSTTLEPSRDGNCERDDQVPAGRHRRRHCHAGSGGAPYRRWFSDYAMRLMPGVGHYPMLEQPARFNEQLHGVLDELAG